MTEKTKYQKLDDEIKALHELRDGIDASIATAETEILGAINVMAEANELEEQQTEEVIY